MKKYLFIIILSLFSIFIHAQSYYTNRGYSYSKVTVQNANGKTDFENTTGGTVIFGTKNGKNVIGISLGRDMVYQGFVIKTEKGTEVGQYTISHKFYANLKGVSTPIVLSEIYDSQYSKTPYMFFLVILDKNAEKPVRYNIFTGIVKSNLYK
jgi:hypothetical protein